MIMLSQDKRECCTTCGVPLYRGWAILQTWTIGLPDFIGDTNPTCQTMSPGGPGRLTYCLKCPVCGLSWEFKDLN